MSLMNKFILSIDIKENNLYEIHESLLSILLKDRTTGNNLLWATNEYQKYGFPYVTNKYIEEYLISGRNGEIIKPRVQKEKDEQRQRAKSMAEVFTPSWVCNSQNNLIDCVWFGGSSPFNNELPNSWITIEDKIEFPMNKTWKDYVQENRLEISCGEAPYLTSRYDSVSGEFIEVKDRIGLLDRKLRVISENTNDEKSWKKWATKALKSIYGYDWQGDNVLLARENLLTTILEFYNYKFNELLDCKEILKYAKIISWNIWQMDGLKYVIPESCDVLGDEQCYIVDTQKTKKEPCRGCLKSEKFEHNGVYCLVKDWNNNKIIRFVDLSKGATI